MHGISPISNKQEILTGIVALLRKGAIRVALLLALLLPTLSSTAFAAMGGYIITQLSSPLLSSPSSLGFEIAGSGAPIYSASSGTSNYPYKVHLKWADNSNDEDYFLVEVLVRKDTWVTVGKVNGNEYIVTTGIEPGKSYTYRVRAVRTGDNSQSGASNIITVTAPAFNVSTAPDHTTCLCQGKDPLSCSENIPCDGTDPGWSSETLEPPTGVSAIAGDGQVTISWTAGNGSTSSLINYGTTKGNLTNIINSAVPGSTINGLTNGQTVYYQVGSRNASATMMSNEYSVTPGLPPAAPSGITSVAGDAVARIAWIAGPDAESSLIKYGTATGDYTSTIDAVSPQIIAGLVNAQKIYFRVATRNAAGTTWSADEYSVTPVNAWTSTPAPTGITITLPQNTHLHSVDGINTAFRDVTFSWSAAGSVSSQIKYDIVSHPGIEDIADYAVTINPAATPRTIDAYASTPRLPAGSTIYYRIAAIYADGTIAWSDEKSTYLGGAAAPTDIVVTPGNAELTFTWTPGAGSEATYISAGATGFAATCTDNGAITTTGTSYTFRGLPNAKPYFRLASLHAGIITNAGSTNCSSVASSFYYPSASAPLAPDTVTSTPGDGQATITWSAVTTPVAAAAYGIRYGTVPSTYTTTIAGLSGTSKTITGLTNGQTIYYTVGSYKSLSGIVYTNWSPELSVTPILPSPPASPTGIWSATGDAKATITWTNGTNSTSSLIRYRLSTDVTDTTIADVVSPKTIFELQNGMLYYYAVGARNTVSTTWSADYNLTPVAPPADAPSGVATVDDTQTTITWTPVAGSDSSQIKYGKSSETNRTFIGQATSPHTITGLSNGTEYSYQVGAYNLGGTTWSAPNTVTPMKPTPSAPTGIEAIVGNTYVIFSWTKGVNAETSLIKYDTTSHANANDNYATSIDPATLPFIIKNLTNGTTYYYRVGAKNVSGAIQTITWSAEYSVTPLLLPPAAPTLISATVANGSTTISWANGVRATSSLVRYGTQMGVYTTTIDNININSVSQFINSLTNNTTYYYQVGANNTAGTTWSDEYSVTPVAPQPTLISPTATAITGTTATLGANVISNGGAAITARGTVWGTSASPTGNILAEGGTATGIFTHARSGLTAGTKIYYRGYATNSAGTGYSPDGSFYTEPSTQASGVTFTAVGSTGMTVNWTRGSGDGVMVLMKQGTAVDSNPVDGTYTGYTANSGFGNGTQVGSGNYVLYIGAGTSVAVTGLTAGTTYYLAVYEYKGAMDTSGVDQGINYKLTPVTGSQTTS